MTTKENLYHFSPTLKAYTKCPARIKCTLQNSDHITEVEYNVKQKVAAEEATMLGTSLGHAQIGHIYSKTRLDAAEIRDTLKELRNEGSALDDPQIDEVRNFIEQQRFMVTHDPTIATREKREILKNLRQAEKDLKKMEVTGGVFHAWKNGLKASLKKVQKPLMATALIGVVAFTASGCAGSTTGEPVEPTKKPGIEETVEPTKASENNCVDDGAIYGDVIADKLEKGPGGEYCSVKINPDSPALKFDKNKVSEEVYAEGYTDAEIEKAQALAVDFAVTQVIDNKYAGEQDKESANINKWFSSEAKDYMTSETISNLQETMSHSNGIGHFTILTDGLVPPIVHDKQSRLKSIDIDTTSIGIKTHPDTGEKKLDIKTTATVTYRVIPEKFSNWSSQVSERLVAAGDVPFAPKGTFDETKPTYMDLPVITKSAFTKESVTQPIIGGYGFEYDYHNVNIYN